MLTAHDYVQITARNVEKCGVKNDNNNSNENNNETIAEI